MEVGCPKRPFVLYGKADALGQPCKLSLDCVRKKLSIQKRPKIGAINRRF
jgi:hypothetical protein